MLKNLEPFVWRLCAKQYTLATVAVVAAPKPAIPIMLLKQQQKKNEAAQQMYDGTVRCSHVDLEYLTLI